MENHQNQPTMAGRMQQTMTELPKPNLSQPQDNEHPRLSHVLHIEDDESIRLIVEMALVDLGGLHVVSCEGGEQAIAQLAQYTPELILLDAMMPRMDGIQTLREIRKLKHTEHTPVVFMTARIQADEKKQYLDAGAIAVIAKPFDATTLAAQLNTIYQNFQHREN